MNKRELHFSFHLQKRELLFKNDKVNEGKNVMKSAKSKTGLLKSKHYKKIDYANLPNRDGFLFEIIVQFVKRRNELNLTQEEVDNLMGTADRLVSKWESGERIPTPFNFYCWAQALKSQLLLTSNS